MKRPDLKTVNKGGRGFGALDKSDREFLKPNFDDKLQSGQRYVGYYNKVSDTPGRSDDE
jgi:hypothetical protein